MMRRLLRWLRSRALEMPLPPPDPACRRHGEVQDALWRRHALYERQQ